MVKIKNIKNKLIFLSVSSLIIVFDQLTKILVERYKPNLDLKLLMIRLVRNTGAGFGIFRDQTRILAVISIIVAVTVILMYNKIPKKNIPQIFSAIFLGGVVGNLIDRLFRNYVIDFIDFKVWPAFNIADSAISISIIILIIYYWKK